MKIAIKVNPTRGKEIIKILSDLGGKPSLYNGNGTIKNYCYFINKKTNNKIEYDIPPTDYKIYTLEEFEKEFPFKIGDKVIPKGTNNPHEIVALEWFVNKLCYKLDNGFHYISKSLTIYKEMKEERNVTLTLDKAKEWYNKGGELKEIALQAFSEKELNSLPKSWEEYCRKYACVCLSTRYTSISSKYDALIKLEQLRDCWRQGWKPKWMGESEKKYAIKAWRNEYTIQTTYNTHEFLTFPTYEMAEEFFKCFRYLIEKAGDLI